MTTRTDEDRSITSQSTYEAELRSYGDMPLGVFRNGGVWPTPRYRYVLCTCARWEERYIVEWLLYHQSIGIDHVYIYCNDDDPTALFAKVLPFTTGPEPFVTFRHYAFQGLQYEMYFHFLRNYSHETKWLIFLDVDEFICIRESNKVEALLEPMPSEIDAVYLNWVQFGHNAHQTRPDGDVLLNYTMRTTKPNPFTKIFIKAPKVPFSTIFQRKTLPIHHDYTRLRIGIKSVNVLGEPLDEYYTNFPHGAGEFLGAHGRGERILARAYIAHFHLKSEQDFKHRAARGLAGDFHAQVTWTEKTEDERRIIHQATNETEDHYLRDYWKAFLAKSWSHSIFPPARWPLLSAGKPATQSSTVHPCTPEEDAAKIVSGRIVAGSQNHTALEPYPWWRLDLEVTCAVHEIRLFNRLDGAGERMSRFIVQTSEDAIQWATIVVRDEPGLFGGADGTPFTWVSETAVPARYVRLTVPGNIYLHLDQFQVYGVLPPL